MARLGFVQRKGERATVRRGQGAKVGGFQRESMDVSWSRYGAQPSFEPDWSLRSFEPDWSLPAGFEVSHPEDALEREANRIAEQVVTLPSQGRRPKRVGLAANEAERVGGGETLPGALRESMEGRFGEDFSGVRLHRDSEAHAMASAVEARAFTVGRDLFFREGAFRPETREGQQLIAHELTHTLQRPPTASPQGPVVQREPLESETSKPSPRPERPAKRFEPGQLVVAKISFALMDRRGGEPGQKKVKQVARSELLRVEGEVPGSLGQAYRVVPMRTPVQEDVAADGKRQLGVTSVNWIEEAPVPSPSAGAEAQTPTQVAARSLTTTADSERSDGASPVAAQSSLAAPAPASASVAPPGPNDVLHQIITLQRPLDVSVWWAAGPKKNPEQWSGPLSLWEQRYIATFTGNVPAPLQMRAAVNPEAPTAEEAAEALRLFGKGAEAASGDARAAILRKYANFENRRRIVAHYSLTHPATVRLQLGLFRFVRDINPIHFAFERGFQVGGGKEMFTDKDVSRVGAAAEFFLALALAYGTTKLLEATKPPTGPTTPMPEVNIGGKKKPPGPSSDQSAPAARPFVAQCTDASCGGASGQMAADHLGVTVTQDQIIKAKGFTPTTTTGHTKMPGGFSSHRALAEALELHAKVPGRTWQAKNVFPKEAGVSRMPRPADLEAGISKALADGGGVFIAKTNLGRHFIVVDDLKGGIVFGRDPAVGSFEITLREFLRVQWDGDVVLAQ